MQELVHGSTPQHGRHLDGIALGDKVIQIRNRPKSHRITAYNSSTRKTERVEVYNVSWASSRPTHSMLRSSVRRASDSNAFRCLSRVKSTFESATVRTSARTIGGTGSRKRRLKTTSNLRTALSVHKAQGSEFDRVYFILPREHTGLVSRELLYTAMTRASRHCTLLIEEDIRPLISATRLERSDWPAAIRLCSPFNPFPTSCCSSGRGTKRARFTGLSRT